MFEFPDRTRNISANAASGDIALNLTPPDEPDTTITIKALPEIGEILVPGGTALLPGQDITASDLTQLVYRPATDGAGDDFFSLVMTEAGGRRTDIAIDVTTTDGDRPQAAAITGLSVPVAVLPSARCGSFARVSPVAASSPPDQSRAVSSRSSMPAASVMSVARSPVSCRRTSWRSPPARTG